MIKEFKEWDIKKQEAYVKQLRDDLHRWNYEYYVLNHPSVDDYTFDCKLKELQAIEEAYPNYYDPNSPTCRVGGEVSEKFTRRSHKEAMLSLENSYNISDIQAFYNNIVKQTKQTDLEFVCEPKIDGLSISCVYADGNFQYGLTRGDGQNGEDVSNNIKTINNIPLVISKNEYFEARGEVYLPKHVLLELNKDKDINFMNTRNTASGALRNLDPKITKKRKLSAWFYYIPLYVGINFSNHYDSLKYLADLHFPVALDVIKKVKGIDGILKYIDWFEKQRSKLDYDVDGVVIKLNDRSLYHLLGTTSKFPKYAIAYKYPPTIGQTRLLDILITVGRTGRINFTAKLEPIEINGSIVQFATLHNADYINERDIQINDYVNIYKAAEVIPKISNPVLSMRDQTVHKFKIPTTCPICNSTLEKKEDEVDLFCVNEECKGRVIQQLIYFCSKDALDIEGLSEATIIKFYNHHLLSKITDFYHLKDHYDEIISLDLHIKNKTLDKLINNIEESKQLSLERILTALGIKFVGQATAKTLAEYYQNIDNLLKTNELELLSLKDIGQKVAEAILIYINNPLNIQLINELKNLGVNFTYKKQQMYKSVDPNHKFFHKSFAITGKFKISRNALIKLIEQKYMGTVVNNITKSTDFLVLGEKPSSKLQKANEWNIKIIKEQELEDE